jgi:tRNA dimethylallyltransferase
MPSKAEEVVAIVGPTAVGKTAVSLRLAEALGGEIVSADSRLVYRGLDIGTAKPTPEEQARVRHHLIDILDPDETLGLAQYQARAYAAIDAIHARGQLPLLVGGTGQYVRGVLQGWTVPETPPNPALRAQLTAQAEREGIDALFARLTALDPSAAAWIDPRNVRRVVRALEVTLTTGRPFSELRRRQPPPYAVLQVGLSLPRDVLYRRADARIDAMIAAGWADEVRSLLEQGYTLDLPSMSSLGYREMARYVTGEIDLEGAVQLIRQATRRFIRHQANWFRPSDPHLHWFDVQEDRTEEIEQLVRAFVSGR